MWTRCVCQARVRMHIFIAKTVSFTRLACALYVLMQCTPPPPLKCHVCRLTCTPQTTKACHVFVFFLDEVVDPALDPADTLPLTGAAAVLVGPTAATFLPAPRLSLALRLSSDCQAKVKRGVRGCYVLYETQYGSSCLRVLKHVCLHVT